MGEENTDYDKNTDVAVLEKDEGSKTHLAASNEPSGKYPSWFTWATESHHIFPYHPSEYRKDWVNVRGEIIAGITVACAQVSESIAFAFIAGTGPMVGLWAAFFVGIIIAFFGSRTCMINGATGVRAAVVAPYIEKEGVGFLFYIVISVAFWQFVAAKLSLARFAKMLSKTVMIGFVCGLAVIVAQSQLIQFQECPGGGHDCAQAAKEYITGATLGLMCMHAALAAVSIEFVFPWISRKIGVHIPASLCAIVIATVVEWAIIRTTSSNKTPTIGDIGKVDGRFPTLFFLDSQYDGLLPPFNWTTIGKAIIPGFLAAAAGGVEAVLTMETVNEMTGTENPAPNQQLYALSAANFVGGMFGTMGGGCTIGLTIVVVLMGANGRYRISAIVAAIFVLFFIMVASDLIAIIPTAALVGMMIVVIGHTFEWRIVPVIVATFLPQTWRDHPRLQAWRKIGRIDAVVIVLVTAVTLIQDLFVATLCGTALHSLAYAWRTGQAVGVRVEYVRVPDAANPEAEDASALTGKDADAIDDDARPLTEGDDSAVAVEGGAVDDDKDEAGVGQADADEAKAGDDDGDADAVSPRNDSAEEADAVSPDDVSVGGSAAEERAADAEDPEAGGPSHVRKVYHLDGHLFFGSAMKVSKLFTVEDDPEDVELWLHTAPSGPQLLDFTAMEMLNAIGEKYGKVGKTFHIRRLHPTTKKMIKKASHLVKHFTYELEEEEVGAAEETGPVMQLGVFSEHGL